MNCICSPTYHKVKMYATSALYTIIRSFLLTSLGVSSPLKLRKVSATTKPLYDAVETRER